MREVFSSPVLLRIRLTNFVYYDVRSFHRPVTPPPTSLTEGNLRRVKTYYVDEWVIDGLVFGNRRPVGGHGSPTPVVPDCVKDLTSSPDTLSLMTVENPYSSLVGIRNYVSVIICRSLDILSVKEI